MKAADHWEYENITIPRLRIAGATDDEISFEWFFKYGHDIIGSGEFGEQVLMATSPLAAKGAVRFNQGVFKA